MQTEANLLLIPAFQTLMTGVLYFKRKGKTVIAVYSDNTTESAEFEDTIKAFRFIRENRENAPSIFTILTKIQEKARGKILYKNLLD